MLTVGNSLIDVWSRVSKGEEFGNNKEAVGTCEETCEQRIWQLEGEVGEEEKWNDWGSWEIIRLKSREEPSSQGRGKQ